MRPAQSSLLYTDPWRILRNRTLSPVTKDPWWDKSNRPVQVDLNTDETLVGYTDREARVVDPPEK